MIRQIPVKEMLEAPIGTVWEYGTRENAVYVKVSNRVVDCESYKPTRHVANTYPINTSRQAYELVNPEKAITPELIAFIKKVHGVDVIVPWDQVKKRILRVRMV